MTHKWRREARAQSWNPVRGLHPLHPCFQSKMVRVLEEFADIQVDLLNILGRASIFLTTSLSSDLGESTAIDAVALGISISNREDINARTSITTTRCNLLHEVHDAHLTIIVLAVGH